MTYRLLSLTLLAAALFVRPLAAQSGGKAPDDEIAGFEVADGVEVTLFASEPMLTNPTNMDIDARGRVWVTEGYNYRMSLNDGNPVREEGDRIVVLEDTDGDGRADEQTVFYQGTDVNSALGIAVLGNRVIVSAAPNVFAFTDEDGDLRADRKEVLFSGIGGKQHDHAMHAFVFGPDGKLYFNFGNEGRQLLDAQGEVVRDVEGRAVRADRAPYQEGMVFRMNPDGTDLEVLGWNFRNNYEVAVDAFGTLWQSDNDDDGNRAVRINYVMEFGNYGFKDEVTGAGWRAPRTGMSEEIPKRHWHQNDPGVVPNLLYTGAGSPTGMVVYEGRLLPERFWDQMIHADAGPNVVRAYPVRPDGAGYAAEIVDLVRSTGDAWFRPSDVTVAPDGSLFISDWYDPGVGGHQVGDLERGRIFRVAPPATPYRVPAVDLSTPEGAVEALKSPNLATRYLAWTALAGWGPEAESALTALWRTGENPRHRARALWLLGRLEGQGRRYVEEALGQENVDLRIAGIRLARQLGLDLIPYLQMLVQDSSPAIRREAAIALRHNHAPEAPELWAALAQQYDGEDPWYLEALGIAADGQWDAFFGAWRDRVGAGWSSPAGREIVWRSRSAAAIPLLGELIADPATPAAERLRYFRAFDFHVDSSKQGVLLALVEGDHPEQADVTAVALRHLDPEFGKSNPVVQRALRRALPHVAGTQEFVDLVRRYQLTDQGAALTKIALSDAEGSLGASAARVLLETEGPRRLREKLTSGPEQEALAAAKVLGALERGDAREVLLAAANDEGVADAVRRAATEAYGRGWGGEDDLVEVLEQGLLDPGLVPVAAGVLSRAYRGSIRRAGERYLATAPAGTNGDHVVPVHVLASRTGSPAEGAVVFERVCSSCHVVRGEGTDFGPELSEIGTKLPKEALYTAIVEPDAGISFGYEGYLIETRDGRRAFGYIVSETESELELRLVGGLTERFAKAEIASRSKLEASLMPPLHQALSEEELVNLVEFLSSLRKP